MEIKGLFIGLNTIDVQFQVDSPPGSNEKVKAKNYGLYTGGPATNAAITFAYLGGKARLISSFGSHFFTDQVLGELKEYHVETTDITPDRSCHPIFATIITTINTGERSVISYHPDYHNYCDITLDNFPVESFDIILTDGFYIDAAISLIQKSKSRIPVILDGGSWKPGLEKLIPLVDIAVCSSDFFPPGTVNHEQVLDFLLTHGVHAGVITRGGQSILVKQENHQFEIPVKAMKAIDTLGAGDIFHGAFCYYYITHENFQKALTDASMIASRSCLSFGTREWMNI